MGTRGRTARKDVRRAGRCLALVGSVVAVLALAGCAGSYTQPATSVTATGATVNGVVFDVNDATITYWFQYGTTTA